MAKMKQFYSQLMIHVPTLCIMTLKIEVHQNRVVVLVMVFNEFL